MFDKEQFIADCHAARDVREVVARAVADPARLMKALGEPKQGGLETLYRSSELMILNVLCRPELIVRPHNHNMWAVIGVYTGREDNILWRRLPDEADGRVEAAGAKALVESETIAFGPDVIHSLINPLPRMSGAIHVYGGDLFGVQRSEWDPQSLCEVPHDMEKLLRAVGGQ
jgi:predicted metal-dependent enzyme (double-stranded beta helix superfamily)